MIGELARQDDYDPSSDEPPPSPQQQRGWLSWLGDQLGPSRAEAAPLLPKAPPGIRAYHSSPHDFERFDASKIGTGEGAQVYGHGLYFAENPAVSGQGGEYWRQFTNRFGGAEGKAASLLSQANFDREQALRFAIREHELAQQEPLTRMFTEEARRSHIEQAAKTVDVLRGDKPVGPRTYEVNINARPEQLLDWDKPLAQQPGQVQRQLEDVYPGLIGETVQRAFPYGIRPQISEALSKAGIPGIKYFDQGSRGLQNWVARHPQGGTWEHPDEQAALAFIARNPEYSLVAPKSTSNYVIFPGNEHLIEIAKKYGLAGATMGGLAALAPDRAEAAQDNGALPDWAPGALAAQDAYRGDYAGGWPSPEAPRVGITGGLPGGFADAMRGIPSRGDATGQPGRMGSLAEMTLTPAEHVRDVARHVGESLVHPFEMTNAAMQGVTPEVPGMWSEADDYRRDVLNRDLNTFTNKTAAGMVFDPMMALGTKMGVPGYSLGSGARLPARERPHRYQQE